MAWQKEEITHKLTVLIKNETEKACLIVTKDISGGKGFREYWLPKSQIKKQKVSKKDEACYDIEVSDWIFNKMEPTTSFVYDSYRAVFDKKTKSEKKEPMVSNPANVPGKRNYVMGPRPPVKAKQMIPDPDLDPIVDDDDIPF